MMRPRVHAVVLAAGASRRMGRPKLALPWGETTVLGQVLAQLAAIQVASTVVVTGSDQETITAIAAAHGVTTVHNPAWATGLTSSLQAGLRSLPAGATAALVVLGDQPALGPAVIEAVIEAFVAGPRDIVVPTHRGRRGHPVLFGQPHFEALLQLAPSTPPRAVMGEAAGAVLELEVGDPAILVDLDSWADYLAAVPPPPSR